MYKINKEKLKPLNKCSKSHDIKGNPISEEHPYSEWVTMSAFWNLADKNDVSDEELIEELEMVRLDVTLSNMCAQGLINMHFNEETGEAEYSITEEGSLYLKRHSNEAD